MYNRLTPHEDEKVECVGSQVALLPRPRCVLSWSCDDKYGLAFCCGAFVALRDVGVARSLRSVLGSGQACLLQAWLMELTHLAGSWLSLVEPVSDSKSRQPDPLHALVRRTVQWCCRCQEWEIFWSRVGWRRCLSHGVWYKWLDPWMEELCTLFKEEWGQEKSRELWLSHNNDRDPLFWFGVNVASNDKAVYVSTQDKGVKMPGYGLRVLSRTQVPDFCRLLTSCVSPHTRLPHGLTLDVRDTHCDADGQLLEVPVTWGVGTGLLVDPLNTAAAGLLFIQERLAVAPAGAHTPDSPYAPEAPDETDRSHKLVLIDAFSHSPSFQTPGVYPQSTKNATFMAHTEVTSAPDKRDERIIAMVSPIKMYEGDSLLGGDHDGLGPYRKFQQALQDHIRKECSGGAQLTEASLVWVKRCLNAGYWRTLAAFTKGLHPGPLVSDSDDPYHIYPTLFPHGSRRRPPVRDLPGL